MRRTIDISAGWLVGMTAKDGTVYRPETVNLPFIHSAAGIAEVTLEKAFPAEDVSEKYLWLELSGFTGMLEARLDGEPVAERDCMQESFRVLLPGGINSKDSPLLRIVLTPRARPDGLFTAGRVSLLNVGEYRFRPDGRGDGARTEVTLTGDRPLLTIYPETENVTNYDTLTAVVKDADGRSLLVKSAKGSAESLTVELSPDDVYDGESRVVRRLELSLLRDTALLDGVNLDVGIYKDEIRDGGFYRNGSPRFLGGVSLADMRSVRSDLAAMEEPGFNAVRVPCLGAKSDVFSALDERGLFGSLDAPYTGAESDFDILRRLVVRHERHPSFTFVCCSSAADAAYASRFAETVRAASDSVFSVLHYNLLVGGQLPRTLPDVIDAVVPFTSAAQDASSLARAFLALAESCPDAVFTVTLAPPPINEPGGLTALSAAQWHRSMYAAFADMPRLIGFYAGDIRSGARRNGLWVDGALTLAGEMYKARFAKEEFLRIEADEDGIYGGKNAEITVYSRNPGFKLLVNSRPAGKFTVTRLAPAVYSLGGIKLDSKTNFIELSAGEQCDSVTVYRRRN